MVHNDQIEQSVLKKSNGISMEIVYDWNYHFLDSFSYNVRTFARLLWRERWIAMTIVRKWI